MSTPATCDASTTDRTPVPSVRENARMRVSAKVDYALRAMAELAAAPPGLTTAEQLATAQQIPPKFLESILAQLRSSGLVASQRGAEGGYQLARPAEEISVAVREESGVNEVDRIAKNLIVLIDFSSVVTAS